MLSSAYCLHRLKQKLPFIWVSVSSSVPHKTPGNLLKEKKDCSNIIDGLSACGGYRILEKKIPMKPLQLTSTCHFQSSAKGGEGYINCDSVWRKESLG
jgi:hypothetical protein